VKPTLFAPETSSSALLIAHCDGGSRGNPGPAGYGAVIEDANGRVLARLSEFIGKKTNNVAEYSGLIAALAWTLENGHTALRVIADSELMVKQMKGQYKVNSPDLRPLWVEAHRLANQLERFEIVHTLRGGNKEADQLANDAMDRGMGRTPSPAANPARSAAAPARASTKANPAPGITPGPGSAETPAKPRLVLEGFVKNGVVHPLGGELPDGIFVKIIRE
jgi:probable phosphoglycerate mutase